MARPETGLHQAAVAPRERVGLRDVLDHVPAPARGNFRMTDEVTNHDARAGARGTDDLREECVAPRLVEPLADVGEREAGDGRVGPRTQERSHPAVDQGEA